MARSGNKLGGFAHDSPPCISTHQTPGFFRGQLSVLIIPREPSPLPEVGIPVEKPVGWSKPRKSPDKEQQMTIRTLKSFLASLCAIGLASLSPAQNAANSGAAVSTSPGRTVTQPLVILGTNVLTPAQTVQFLNGSGSFTAQAGTRGMGIGQPGTGTTLGQPGTTVLTPPNLPPPTPVPTPNGTFSSPNPAVTPQGVNPAITPQDVMPGAQDLTTLPPETIQGQGLGVGQQGGGTTPGQQGFGTGVGQPGTTTIGPQFNQPNVGQQGATTLTPTNPGAAVNPQLNPNLTNGLGNSITGAPGTNPFVNPGFNNNQLRSGAPPQGSNLGVAPGTRPGALPNSPGGMIPGTTGAGTATGSGGR
jgi:hypothetical protein